MRWIPWIKNKKIGIKVWPAIAILLRYGARLLVPHAVAAFAVGVPWRALPKRVSASGLTGPEANIRERE